MWNLKNYISLVCLFAAAVNPVVAAAAPCFCTRPTSVKPSSCCHAKAETTSRQKVAGRNLCATNSARDDASSRPCQCCVKSVPEPIPLRVFEFKSGFNFALPAWESPTHRLVASTPLVQRYGEELHQPSGRALLAIYCKWLN